MHVFHLYLMRRQAEKKVNFEFTSRYLAHFIGDLPLQKEVEARQ